MALGRPVWLEVRKRLTELLALEGPRSQKASAQFSSACLFKQSDVEMLLPVKVGDYTDFYSSREHATNLGKMFRPNEAALKPNWFVFYNKNRKLRISSF
jgi:fumarylacetoacetase